MATFNNDLRLKEIVTGAESGTWGTSTNTNLSLVADAFSLGTKQMAADANETFTMPDATADGTRSLYLKITSAVSLTATRTVTLAPNTVSKVWIIENATTGSQIITIAQGSGATVNVPSGAKLMVVTDGAGGGAAVFNANPTTTVGTVTSVGGTGTVNGITLTGTVTSSGDLTLGGTLANVSLTTQVTGTLPVANGGTGITSFGAGVATWLGTPSSANLAAAVTDETGSGALVFATSPTLVTPALGTPSALVGTNITGTAAGLTAGNVTTNANLTGAVTSVGNATSLGSFTSTNLRGALTDETGTGSAVFATSPTLVTPILGTPTSGVATNLTGLPLTTGVTGTLPVANGGTGITSFGSGVATWLGTPSSANLAAAVTDETGTGALVFATSPTLVTPVLGTPTSGTLSGCTVDGTNAVGFRTLPQVSQSAAYTLVLTDSGKHILHPSADTTARIFTIPANSSVAYPIGTAITFINQNGAGVITIAITTDTMRLAGVGTTGSRTLAANGIATCVKITSTEWIISGTGLT